MSEHETEGLGLSKIRADRHDVDTAASAAEILAWLRDNVGEYIDNERYDYNVMLNTISRTSFKELRKLEDLFTKVFAVTGPTALSEESEDPAVAAAAKTYKRLMAGETITEEEHDALQEAWGRTQDAAATSPEVDGDVALEAAGLEILYPTLDAVLEEMQKPTPLLAETADKLAYFYELKGWKGGDAIEQKFDATLDFKHLEYSPDPVIMAKRYYEEKELEDGTKEKVLVETKYRLGCAGGFMVSFDLKLKPKEAPLSLF